MKKILEYIEKFLIPYVVTIGIISSIFTFIENEKKDSSMLITIQCAAFLMISVIYTFIQKINKSKEVEILEKWIKYNKKREEIDEKIAYLNKQIMYYDKESYLDLNRMIFSAQSTSISKKMINYNNFISQFGLDVSTMNIKERSALFLTPFNPDGSDLFKKCRDILGEMDIFLQRTDNYMEKEDIMMNIVSLILQSEIIIVNINGRNPNVYYELGISHTIGKPTILLSKADNDILSDVGFDIRQRKIVIYQNYTDLEKQLLYIVSNIRRNI